MTFLEGYKTYIAALGFLGLGIYQMTQGDMQAGIKSITNALMAFGLRQAIGGR
jgi:hypothetical protein